MDKVIVNFNKETGKVKPMHAVNNGPTKPAAEQTVTNFYTWLEAGIPMVRNHDASLAYVYGGPHTVDVDAIFPDFDADVNDPASYDFVMTDEYTQTILDAGSEVFYRLGTKIEWGKKKYGTWPPKDFKKWAEICEHIIMHFNEGWADGFHWNIKYWEIWNEPDNHENDPIGTRPTWQGTREQFYDFYETASKHLKKRFPDLKFGGPALTSGVLRYAVDFLPEMQRREVPMDFFSWHFYKVDPKEMIRRAEAVRQLLDENGYQETENILNEWNYVRNWTDQWVYSIEQIIGMKGAAYTAACMCAAQQSSIDMLMYYDARLDTAMNGMFNLYTLRPLKGYYPFKMFNTLYRMGVSVQCETDSEDVYAVAAKDEKGNSSVMLCYYSDDDAAEEKSIHIEMQMASDKYELYLLDEEHEETLVNVVENSFDITLKSNSVVLLKNVCEE